MSEFANNESAFEALLESIKQASNNIKRDAGTRFETLIKDWLTQDQPYRDLFSKVETFEEWASSHPDLKQSGKDIGIDLVATLEDDPKAFDARVFADQLVCLSADWKGRSAKETNTKEISGRGYSACVGRL